jgi:hypothetical protein
MNGVEAHDREVERVSLHEFERVVRLRVQVNADDLETGLRVAHRGSTGPAEQV